jgi:1-deoxy-D-xylulose-5-phosphate reductoisomerase
MIQTVAILGATGSIGIQTISIISQFPHFFKPTLLSANQSIQKLLSISSPFPEVKLALHDQNVPIGPYDTDLFLLGNKKIITYLQENPPDILVIAVDSISCFEILREVYPFIKKIAISSKEILILAGICKLLPKIKKNTKILPLDSEHVAIHQLIQKVNKKQIKKIVLTASGGPFFGSDK